MLVSRCHSAKLRVEGSATMYYVCSTCNRPCDGKFVLDFPPYEEDKEIARVAAKYGRPRENKESVD